VLACPLLYAGFEGGEGCDIKLVELDKNNLNMNSGRLKRRDVHLSHLQFRAGHTDTMGAWWTDPISTLSVLKYLSFINIKMN
jgi:hypothetical protein